MAGVSGLDEILRNLEELPAKLEQRTLRRGLKAAAEVFQKGAQQRVRKKSGKTAEAIKVSSTARNGFPQAKVQLKGPHSYIGWFLEWGVAPHFISGGDGLSARKLTQKIRVSGENDGRKPTPGFPDGKFAFMRPTMDQDREEATNALISKVRADMQARGYDQPYNEQDDA